MSSTTRSHARRPAPPPDRPGGLGDQRVDDGFQPPEGLDRRGPGPRPARPVDGAVDDHARKGLAHRPHGRAARRHRGVHGGVGVPDDRRPPRRTSPPVVDLPMPIEPVRPSTITRVLQMRPAPERGHRDRRGGGPKKASKDGTAWPISIARPSTVGQASCPRRRQEGRLERADRPCPSPRVSGRPARSRSTWRRHAERR